MPSFLRVISSIDVAHRRVEARRAACASPACISACGPHQALAELAARVQVGEVVLAEAAPHQQRHRQRVAERERRGRARGRREVQRAGLLVDVRVERRRRRPGRASTRRGRSARSGVAPSRLIASSTRSTSCVSPLCDSAITTSSALDARRDRRARLRPDAGRRPACRCWQRRGDLPADDARLAHAGDDDAAAAAERAARRPARSDGRASRTRPRIAAASVSSTLAREREAVGRWRRGGGRPDGHGSWRGAVSGRHGGRLHRPGDGVERDQARRAAALRQIEPQRVLAVALRPRRALRGLP